MAATVNWDPNRYGSTKRVLSYNASTGNYSVVDQDHNYTGINYNFTALPAAGTTTGTTTGTTDTTQTQTASAFGDVKPYYWQDEGGQDGGANVFSGYQKEKEPVTELSGFFDPLRKASAGQKLPLGDRLRHQFADFTGKTGREWEDVDRALDEEYYKEKGLVPPWGTEKQPSKFRQTISDFGSAIKTRTKGLLDRPIPFMPGMTFLQAANKVLRPGANQSFRNIAGLYGTEINLMKKYGSVGVTDMNPTGDPRKDDAGYNIVSGAMNYNKIGTSSRRHNMLKEADIYEKGSSAWKNKRNQIRADWKKEKDSGTKNDKYKDVEELQDPKKLAKEKTITVTHPTQERIGQNGGVNGGPTGHGDAGKAGGESTSTLGSF